MSNERPTHDEVVDETAATARDMEPQRVPVNAYETSSAFVIVAPMPAVTAGDVTIELSEGTLRFWAELRSAGPREFTIHEWRYGGYEREVDVPDGYGSGLDATLSNGQLAIRVRSGAPTGPIVIQPTAPTSGT